MRYADTAKQELENAISAIKAVVDARGLHDSHVKSLITQLYEIIVDHLIDIAELVKQDDIFNVENSSVAFDTSDMFPLELDHLLIRGKIEIYSSGSINRTQLSDDDITIAYQTLDDMKSYVDEVINRAIRAQETLRPQASRGLEITFEAMANAFSYIRDECYASC